MLNRNIFKTATEAHFAGFFPGNKIRRRRLACLTQSIKGMKNNTSEFRDALASWSSVGEQSRWTRHGKNFPNKINRAEKLPPLRRLIHCISIIRVLIFIHIENRNIPTDYYAADAICILPSPIVTFGSLQGTNRTPLPTWMSSSFHWFRTELLSAVSHLHILFYKFLSLVLFASEFIIGKPSAPR